MWNGSYFNGSDKLWRVENRNKHFYTYSGEFAPVGSFVIYM